MKQKAAEFKAPLAKLGLILVFLLSACAPAPTPAPLPTETALPTPSPVSTLVPVPGSRFIIAYYPSWVAGRGALVKDIPAEKLTHINYAFSNVSGSGECILGDVNADVEKLFTADQGVSGTADDASVSFHGNFNQLLELKRKYPHLKVLISIGGWSWSGNFTAAAQDDASRRRFAASCIDLYLKQYNGVFDGLDIDWEYPVSGGLNPGKAEDKINYTLLLTELRRQLDELGAADNVHYLLTIAAPVGPGNIRNLELKKIAEVVDWINLMGYDFHGTWETSTNFNAPLFRAAGDPADAGLNIDSAVQSYLTGGVPAGKLVLGVPFYAKGWSGVAATDNGLYQSAVGAAPGTFEAGSYTYNDLQANFLSQSQRFWSAEAQVPWLYDPQSKIFISYDDPQSITAKAGYARDVGLSGIMIWEISQGDETLLDAIYKGFETGGPPRPTPTPVVQVPRPFEQEIHAAGQITLDGLLNDWPENPDIELNQAVQIAYKLAPTSWGGPQDLSAKIWVGWSVDGLYFALKVMDDKHVQPKADSDLWHGDHVELQFDTRLDEDYTNPGMNDDDFQIGLSLGDFAKVPPAAFAWFNGPGLPGLVNTIQMAYTSTEEGYILEVFVPKEDMAGITLADGASFGMNVSPSDADDAAQGQKVMLSTSLIRTYADPRTFGKIVLVP